MTITVVNQLSPSSSYNAGEHDILETVIVTSSSKAQRSSAGGGGLFLHDAHVNENVYSARVCYRLSYNMYMYTYIPMLTDYHINTYIPMLTDYHIHVYVYVPVLH